MTIYLKIFNCLFTALCVSVVWAASDEVSCDLGDSIYSKIAELARTQANVEASSKFKCEFNFGDGSWTNGTGKAFFIEHDSRWIKVDDQGRVAQAGPKSSFPEFVWIENRKRMLIAELQTKEPFATKIAVLKKKKAAAKAKKDAEEAEIARINSICIDELFGIKFGSDEYQFSRTNLNDRLGLSSPTDMWGSRKIRLLKPEFGFTHGWIRCAESGSVYSVHARMELRGKDGASPLSKDEVCAVMKNIVDALSIRYGIKFSVIKHNMTGFCDSYLFNQESRHFLISVSADLKLFDSKKSPPTVDLSAYYTDRRSGPSILGSKFLRFNRTREEENNYNRELVISNLWGHCFGELCTENAGHTITQRLPHAQGVFEDVILSYNTTGSLYRISMIMEREKLARKSRISTDEAGEILHREIVALVRGIEDQYQISWLSGDLGDDLTYENGFVVSDTWPRKIDGFGCPRPLDAKMTVRTREDLFLVGIVLTYKPLAKKMPPDCCTQRRSRFVK